MKPMRRKLALFLAAVLCIQPAAVMPARAEETVEETTGTVYYVDSELGADTNSGMDESSPWKTVARVNEEEFEPGDKILFKAGSVWSGEQLAPKGNGTADEPITVDRYGSDSEYPVIHASAVPGSSDFSGASQKNALHLKDVSYWTVQNLELTNYGVSNANNDAAEQKNRNGVYLEVTSGHVMKGIVLDGLYVHDVNGSNWKHNTEEGAGIRFNAMCTAGSNNGTAENSSWFDGLTIQNCYVENVMRNGICQYFDYGGHPWGHGSWDQQWYDAVRSKNVIIRGNVLKDVAGDGIKLWGTDGALVESNLVIHAGANPARSSGNSNLSAAVWPFDCNEAVFQYNEVCYTGVQRGTEIGDGEAFDGDYYCTNSLFQYNYSHNNEGGFLMICGPEYAYSDGAVARYNISENDGSIYAKRTVFQIGGGGGVDHTYIYNNTIYVGAEQSGYRLVHGEPWDGKPKGTHFENNIFYIDGDLTGFGFAGDSRDKGKEGIAMYDNNLYAGSFFDPKNLPADMPEDEHAVFGDPEFVNAGNGGDGYRSENGKLNQAAIEFGPGYYAAGAYKIQEGSAAIGSGKVIDQSNLGQKLTGVAYYPGDSSDRVDKGEYFNVGQITWKNENGGRDFFGNAVSEAEKPDIGAHQYSGSTEEKNPVRLANFLENVPTGSYEAASAEAFAKALADAKAAGPDQTAAYDALKAAYDGLVADKSELHALYETCKSLWPAYYTAESYRELAYGLKFAGEVLENSGIKAEQVSYALERLATAKDHLQEHGLATGNANYCKNDSFEETTNGALTYWDADLIVNGDDNTVSRRNQVSWNGSVLRPAADSNMGVITKSGAFEAGMEQVVSGLPQGNYSFTGKVAANLYDTDLAEGEYAVLQIYEDDGKEAKEIQIPESAAGSWADVSVSDLKITNGKCRIRFAICSKTEGTQRFLAADSVSLSLVRTQESREELLSYYEEWKAVTGDYTDGSMQVYQNAVKRAEEVLGDAYATQEQMQSAKSELEKAVDGLVRAYEVSVAKVTGGTVTADAKKAEEGKNVSLNIRAADGYRFKGIAVRTESGKAVEVTETDGNYHFTMPAEKVEITAEFEKIPEYQISVSNATGGTVTAEAETAKEGERVVFHVTPAEGYLLKGVAVRTETGAAVEVTEADGSYSFTMPSENVEIAAEFEKIPEYEITTVQTEGGTVTADLKTAKAGTAVNVHAAAADGYQLTGIAVRMESGETVSVSGTNGNYSFIMPARRVTVTGVFQKNPVSQNPDSSAKDEQEHQKLLQEQKTFQAYKVKLKNVKAQKKKAVVSWKKIKNADGYIIEYALKSNFKAKQKVTVKRGTVVKKTLKKLKSGKRYFIRIRAYRTIGGKKVYTKYSTKKKVTVK